MRLAAAGFEAIGIEPTRVYDIEGRARIPDRQGRRRRGNRAAGRGEVHERDRAREEASPGKGDGIGDLLRTELLRLASQLRKYRSFHDHRLEPLPRIWLPSMACQFGILPEGAASMLTNASNSWRAT
jgi:hypothetical protein